MSEARDALAVALDECGFLDTAYPPSNPRNADAILAALPDGWVLARRQDAEDGAALRELREALGETEGWRMGSLERGLMGEGWRVYAHGPTSDEKCDKGHRHYETMPIARGAGPTIAAAARKAREALP